MATTRLLEAEEAARILGIQQVHSLGHHDGELVADLELRAQIARFYRITQADTLFTFDPFWPGQVHPDHRAAGQPRWARISSGLARLYSTASTLPSGATAASSSSRARP